MLIIDIQRGGPVHRPADQDRGRRPQPWRMYGRHGEAPLPIVAAYSPSHCFDAAIEAARIAIKYRTPVILLSDGYLANGSEPWRLPDVDVAARHLGAVPDRAQRRRRRRQPGVLALPPRPRDARPAVGDPRHARADAPRRRAREGRQHRQHRLHAREPRADGAAAGGEDRRHRRRHPAARDRRRRRRRLLRARLGLDVGGDPRRRAAPAPRRRRSWRGST